MLKYKAKYMCRDENGNAYFAKAVDAKIAKLTEALKTLEKEHRHQSECWSLTEDGDQSEYHKKWADFCSKALEEE